MYRLNSWSRTISLDFQYGPGISSDVPRTPNPKRLVQLQWTVNLCLCRLKADRNILTVQTTARYSAEVPNLMLLSIIGQYARF